MFCLFNWDYWTVIREDCAVIVKCLFMADKKTVVLLAILR